MAAWSLSAAQQAQSKNIAASPANAAQRIAGHEEAQYIGDEDGDDVFSNPDTAELDTRSDATGATSPTPQSPGPGPGSPSNRASHGAILAGPGYGGIPSTSSTHPSQHASIFSADTFGLLKHGDVSHKPLILSHLPPPPSAADIQGQPSRLDQGNTPRPSPAQLTPRGTTKGDEHIGTKRRSQGSRPSFMRTKSASGASVAGLGSPNQASSHSAFAQGYQPGAYRLGGHASSLSASHAHSNAQHLPSAHGLPSDPREAMSLATLFAHAPMHSPNEEQPGFSLTPADSSNKDRDSLALESRRRSLMQPISPERLIASLAKGSASASQSPRLLSAQAPEDSVSSESSIFERDIEHRNAAHVLSKSEAIDVAIPSVLDDAIEAITADNAEIEIIAPHTALPPLALSAQALNIHSHSHSPAPQTAVTAPGSASLSESPVLAGSSGPATGIEPPPGSIAAQIAERFSQQKTSSLEPIANAGRHRRPLSDASVSSSSSMRSRSPQAPLVSVQKVLAGNASPTAPRSISHSPPAVSKESPSPPVPTGTDVPARGRAGTAAKIAGQPSESTLTPSKSGMSLAPALPSLPLPNPFRSLSPAASLTPQLGGADLSSHPMQSSVSMDGAIMPSGESAILDASLDGLTDVVTNSPAGIKSLTSSPIARLRGLAIGDEAYDAVETSPYSSRSPAPAALLTTPNSPASPVVIRQRRKSPVVQSTDRAGGWAAAQLDAASSSSIAGTGAKKRLSFFSYADVLNEAPAEILRMDDALQQTNASSTHADFQQGSSIMASPASRRASIDGRLRA